MQKYLLPPGLGVDCESGHRQGSAQALVAWSWSKVSSRAGAGSEVESRAGTEISAACVCRVVDKMINFSLDLVTRSVCVALFLEVPLAQSAQRAHKHAELSVRELVEGQPGMSQVEAHIATSFSA